MHGVMLMSTLHPEPGGSELRSLMIQQRPLRISEVQNFRPANPMNVILRKSLDDLRGDQNTFVS